eukprot:m.286663 g.286663  ORF g.286663 m.286663 type:complete len:542 (+) comp15781_c1_seq2:195-1820(+)
MLAQLVRLDPSLGCSMEEDERLLMSLGDTDGAFDAHACSDEKLEPIGVVRGQQYQQRKLPCRAPSKAASQPQAQRQNTRRKFKARRQPKGVVHSILAPPQSDDTKRSMEPLLLVNMTGHGQQAPDHLSSKQNLQPLPPPLPNPYVRPSVFIPRPSDIRQQTVKRSPLPAPRMKSVQQHRLQLHRLMDIIKRHENNYNLAPVTTVDVQTPFVCMPGMLTAQEFQSQLLRTSIVDFDIPAVAVKAARRVLATNRRFATPHKDFQLLLGKASDLLDMLLVMPEHAFEEHLCALGMSYTAHDTYNPTTTTRSTHPALPPNVSPTLELTNTHHQPLSQSQQLERHSPKRKSSTASSELDVQLDCEAHQLRRVDGQAAPTTHASHGSESAPVFSVDIHLHGNCCDKTSDAESMGVKIDGADEQEPLHETLAHVGRTRSQRSRAHHLRQELQGASSAPTAMDPSTKHLAHRDVVSLVGTHALKEQDSAKEWHFVQGIRLTDNHLQFQDHVATRRFQHEHGVLTTESDSISCSHTPITHQKCNFCAVLF